MAIQNGKFTGIIDGKCLKDYSITYKGDCKRSMSLEELEHELNKRKSHLNKVLNVGDNGWCKDEFWIDIWDVGCCKVNINTTNSLWSETNVASRLESFGTYLLTPYDIMIKKVEEDKLKDDYYGVVWNYNRPKENELDDEVINDSNYRLAPKEDIFNSDFKHRKAYSKDYAYYKDVVYANADKMLRSKMRKDLINRYGYCDEKFEYTPYELKDYDTWRKIKDKEDIKIKLLKDANKNLNVLKGQMSKLKDGEQLLFNTYEKEGKRYFYKAKGEDSVIAIPKIEEENRILKLSKQLERMGLDNSKILELESKLYVDVDRPTNVNLNHVTSNLGDIKDYMIQVKLAYNNRVFINPKKCPNVKHAEDIVDYTNVGHVKALMYLPENHTIDPFDYLSPMSYDITNMIEKLHRNGTLSDRDLEIVEGFRFGVSQEQLGEELGIPRQNVGKLFDRIARNITQGFIEDEEDLFYLNVLKGQYKKCSKCGKIKLIQRFDKKASNKDGYKNICKKCK